MKTSAKTSSKTLANGSIDRITIGKEFTFDAAHLLPEYPGKCAKLHGHTYKLTIRLSGKIDPKSGFVLDFSSFGDFIKASILSDLDHTYLNDLLSNPTAEFLALWIRMKLEEYLWNFPSVQVEKITLYETPNSFVEV
jgi:6-pyruvoyltetrahydropterin/6-carboxytetrahydropterin synthase